MSQTILESWTKEWPEVHATEPRALGESVLDKNTFNTIEVDELYNSLNYASTLAGQSVLFRSLVEPLDDQQQIIEKQDAVRELQQNEALKQKIQAAVAEAGQDEKGLYQLLFGSFLGMFGTSRENHRVEGYGYEPYIKSSRMFISLVDNINALPEVKSAYLNGLLDKIKNFASSRPYALMKGPVYKTEHAIYSKADKPKLAPAIIFKPRIFKPVFIVFCFVLLWLVNQLNPIGSSSTPDFSFSAGPLLLLFTIPLLLLYIPVVGSFDRDNIIIPLRDEFRQSDPLRQALDALGQLDELLSFIKFSESFGSATILPEIISPPHHQIELQAVKNPVLGKNNPDYIANDFKLWTEKLVFVTGPNSGGKTAFCKTLTQVQLISQIGCFIPAEQARIAVADRIFYQVPEISHLEDGEGRFGSELKRTREIFVASSEKSLVVLDELSEGTTFEEKMETSSNILNGFYQKGNNTVLITHNHQLVDEFVNKNIGLAKQAEFAHDEPTYKLVPGISRVSHADRVAKKIGFSKQDIENLLTKK